MKHAADITNPKQKLQYNDISKECRNVKRSAPVGLAELRTHLLVVCRVTMTKHQYCFINVLSRDGINQLLHVHAAS